jgi:hypothetical protein
MQIKLVHRSREGEPARVETATVQTYAYIREAAQATLAHFGAESITAFVPAEQEGRWIPWGTWTAELHDTDRTFAEGDLPSFGPLEVR